MKIRIAWFKKEQAGYTLIELMLAIVISAFISLGASMSISQVIDRTSYNSNYTIVNRNAMNAIYWIAKDAMMSQNMNGVSNFPSGNLSLSWMEWDNTSHIANYSVQDGILYRYYNVDGQLTNTIIAEDISSDPVKTYCSTDNGTLSLTITSYIGQGSKMVYAQRVREIVLRPKL
jgi:prepilin-type N-terminal cleavage/methylation domain-containing protein